MYVLFEYNKIYEQGEKDGGIKELEKIKTECNDLLEFHGERKDDLGIGKIQAYQHIIEFVNERITELKGENNDK